MGQENTVCKRLGFRNLRDAEVDLLPGITELAQTQSNVQKSDMNRENPASYIYIYIYTHAHVYIYICIHTNIRGVICNVYVQLYNYMYV